MTSTIHYVTEMVEVATGKIVERKLLTLKGSCSSADLAKSVPATKKYRKGAYECRVTKMWAA